MMVPPGPSTTATTRRPSTNMRSAPGRTPGGLNIHPTQKPLELFLRPIEYHTEVNDICYEPFLGSGTQLIAAEKLGRVCYALEREPSYVDVAVRRWEAFTGEKAVKEDSE